MRSLTRIFRFTSQLWKFYLGVVISAVIVAVGGRFQEVVSQFRVVRPSLIY